jgi:type 1 glutamine amidotransferase
VKYIIVVIVVSAMVSSSLPIVVPVLDEGVENGLMEAESGNVFYMMPGHSADSLRNTNVAKSIVNAVYHFGGNEIPIDVLVYANMWDRGEVIRDYFVAHADIVVTLTTDDFALLTIDSYDVVIIHSKGAYFSTSVEQSIADYLDDGGSVIGCHDLIWGQFNNPILEDVFGATAFGDASTPSTGFFSGDFDIFVAQGHPIMDGLDNFWRMSDQFFFNVDFKREITVLWETSWQGEMIPVAWTFSTGPQEIEADVDCHPKSLNRWSMGNWITCYIELPSGYFPEDIDPDTILLNGLLKPVLDPRYDFVTDETEYITDHDNDNIRERMVKFVRDDVQDALPLGVDVEILIEGYVGYGIKFTGIAEIRHFEPIGLVK